MILFDGAMGTWYAQKHHTDNAPEQANVSHPERIYAIHREYIDAGAGAIVANTFHTDVEEQIRAGARLALAAADGSVVVYGSLGPAASCGDWKVKSRILLEEGITHFLFETLSDGEGLEEIGSYIKGLCPDAWIVASFSVLADGYTASGVRLEELAALVQGCVWLDGFGLNCVIGPRAMLGLAGRIHVSKFVLFRPNAGAAVIAGRQARFQNGPAYFAQAAAALACDGLGGCCGTTPAHIRELAGCLHPFPEKRSGRMESRDMPVLAGRECSSFSILVELDPPRTDALFPFLDHARRLQAAGADMLTIADCPAGRPRADSCMLAARLHRELEMPILPHITCRDRNRTAIKALLLGLSMECVDQVLVVTGDPVPEEDRSEVQQVYNFHSRKLARYIQHLRSEGLLSRMEVYGALNVNAVHFEKQLELALEKEANGISAFLTQPVLSEAAFVNLKRAREVLAGRIYAGIYPVVSWKNGLFLENEVPGIHVDADLLAQYEGLDRDAAEELAWSVSVRIAEAVRPFCDGLYLMMPFSRIDLMERILGSVAATKK